MTPTIASLTDKLAHSSIDTRHRQSNDLDHLLLGRLIRPDDNRKTSLISPKLYRLATSSVIRLTKVRKQRSLTWTNS